MNEDYGYRIHDSTGDAQPYELMSDFFAADWIRVCLQQSCAYGPPSFLPLGIWASIESQKSEI